LGFPLLARLSSRKLDRLEWSWFLGFGFLALWGERYVVWFIFILVVLTSRMVPDWKKSNLGGMKRALPVINLTLALILTLLPLALLPGLREKWWTHAPSPIENTPVSTTEWLADHPGLPGPLWSEIGFSSYLEFALPERPTWIDTRFEVFPVEQWQAYVNISYARFDWERLLEATGANLLMVSTQNQPELLSALESSTAWCELRRDTLAVLYQRGACGGH
jgi:hypothetical protein